MTAASHVPGHAKPAAPGSGPADTVLRNGVVHCLDDRAGTGQALAIRGGHILAVGDDAAIEPHIGPGTRVIDLAGRAVLPGINDAHIHALWMGARWPNLFFEGDPQAGHGKLIHSRDDLRKALVKAWGIFAQLGITSYTEPGIGPGENDGETGCFGTDALEVYAELAGTPAQTARVTMLRLFGILDGESHFADVRKGLDTPVPSTDPRWVSVNGLKVFGDGIPPMRSAWTRVPYAEGGTGGLMTGAGDEQARLAEFVAMIELAHVRGLQVAIHATGDRCIEEFIATIERLGGAGNLRHYVIHGDLIAPEQVARLEKAGMGITIQPLIADHTGAWLASAVRPEVARDAFPFHLMMGKGLRATLGSDSPIASPDWRRTVASVAAHLEKHGQPVGRAEMTRLLQMYTSIPADQDGALSWKGTLEAGKVADLCVLAADPYAVGAAALPQVDIDLTMVDGRIVFERTLVPA